VTELADPPDHRPRLTYLIKRLQMAERARMEDALHAHRVTVHQYTALSLLERRDGLSSAQLARRHFVTPQAMNQLVATLEREGLIRREPDQRRTVLGGAFDLGSQLRQRARPVASTDQGG
jgi:DNA-binding MarR family transcriptional regulator